MSKKNPYRMIDPVSDAHEISNASDALAWEVEQLRLVIEGLGAR